MLRRLPVFLASLAFLLALAYGAMLGVLALGQGRLMYPAPSGGHVPAAPGWTEIALTTSQGRMAAYHLPARGGMPTVVFLHGNGTGYRGSVQATAPLAERGMGILVPEYPGYGGNPGRPGEEALAEVAEAARAWLSRTVPTDRLVIYGNSVGTGPATRIAVAPNRMLVLVSPVASMVDVVRHHYPFAPGFLVRDRYDNERTAARAAGRVVVLHAVDDAVVPFEHGKRLAEKSAGRMITIPTGGHGIAFDPKVGGMVADIIMRETTN